LNDDTVEIKGEALVTVDFNNVVNKFTLDLVAKSGAYGMEVSGVLDQ
jgi:hypothetical protein